MIVTSLGNLRRVFEQEGRSLSTRLYTEAQEPRGLPLGRPVELIQSEVHGGPVKSLHDPAGATCVGGGAVAL